MSRLRISASVERKLIEHHLCEGKNVESISFIYGHAYYDQDGELVIVLADPDAVQLLAEDCYDDKSFSHISVPTDVRAGVYWRAVLQGYSIVVDCHDHHMATTANFSGTDDRDDLGAAEFFNVILSACLPVGQPICTASLLLARSDWAARHVSYRKPGTPEFVAMTVDIIGERFSRYHQDYDWQAYPEEARHAAMISSSQMTTIHSLHVVIVGAGGTGSIAIETLGRSGFRHITCIDGDLIESSNLNRFQGAAPSDVGRGKAEFLAARARSLFPSGHFESVPGDAFSERAIAALGSADLIVSCVDNAETRWWLNRFAVQFLIPYFDCGVLIDTNPLIFHSRVNSVIPGLSRCGHCSDIEFIPRKQPDGFLDAQTLAAQRAAGYARTDAPEQAPSWRNTPEAGQDAEPERAGEQVGQMLASSAYLLNQQAVSAMVKEILNWICGWQALAHSLYQRSDRCQIERLDRENYPADPAEDCSVCSFLTGTCFQNRLPRSGEGLNLSNIIPA